jgi:hypothetical protein
MKITIENTDRVIRVISPDGSIPGRLWIGKTEAGIAVQLLVTRIAVAKDHDQSEFQRELRETEGPSPENNAFPLRMVL